MSETSKEIEPVKRNSHKLRNVVLGGLAAVAIVAGIKVNSSSESEAPAGETIPRVTRDNFMQKLTSDKNIYFTQKEYPGHGGRHLIELGGLKPRGVNLIKVNLETGQSIEIDNPNMLVEEVNPETVQQAAAVALATNIDFIDSFEGQDLSVRMDGEKEIVDLWSTPYFHTGDAPVKKVEVVIDKEKKTLEKVVDDKIVGYIHNNVVVD
jgi:hypothetical protein